MGSSPSSGTVVVDHNSVTQLAQSIIIDEFSGVSKEGTNGSGAIVQSSIEELTAVTNASHTLSAFADSANATFGFTGNLGEGIIAGSGFTELAEIGADFEVIQTQWRVDNDTTVTWTDVSAGNENWGVGGIELKNLSLVVATASAAGTSGHLGIMF